MLTIYYSIYVSCPPHICVFFAIFRPYLVARAPLAQTPNEVDRGRLPGQSRRGLGAIRAVERAQKFFSGRESTRHSQVFSVGVFNIFFVLCLAKRWCLFAHTRCSYAYRARLAVTLVPCAWTGLGYIILQFCAFCVACVMRYFFHGGKKK